MYTLYVYFIFSKNRELKASFDNYLTSGIKCIFLIRMKIKSISEFMDKL